MKNELLAQAMTHIDEALIAEADEAPAAKRSRITSQVLLRGVRRWGGAVAAVALIAICIFFSGSLGGRDVLLYGESIADSPRTVNEYIPRSVAYVVDTVADDINLPLELEFKQKTKLTLSEGRMLVFDENGETVCEGREYIAYGKTSVCLILPGDADECIIETSRGNDIVLTRDTESGIWYVYIEKN